MSAMQTYMSIVCTRVWCAQCRYLYVTMCMCTCACLYVHEYVLVWMHAHECMYICVQVHLNYNIIHIRMFRYVGAQQVCLYQ